MNILLIEDQPRQKDYLVPYLRKRFQAILFEASSIQQGIELLEKKETAFDLIICDYHGPSPTLVSCLLQLGSTIPCIVFADDPNDIRNVNTTVHKAPLECRDRSELSKNLTHAIESLASRGLFSDHPTPDQDFIQITSHSIAPNSMIRADIFLKLAANRYCRLIPAGETFLPEDHDRYVKQKKIPFFYFHKSQVEIIVNDQGEELVRLANEDQLDAEEARAAEEEALTIVKDIVNKLGFTVEAKELARKAAILSLKALGASPKLSLILARLRENEGLYITSHSIMLGEIACAIACQSGWNSSPTFLKLTVAAFLHDLPLKDNRLARIKNLDETANVTVEEMQELKLHPLRAAEFARKFNEMPPNIDTILMEHHELPDGKGYPRGLTYHQLSPLSCIFIIAHDMLHFFLENPSRATLDAFLESTREKYSNGVFKKICKSLESGDPVPH